MSPDVLTHFAKDSVPCLGCHDSFIVPHYAGGELFRVMHQFYRERMDYLPEVKG